MSCSSSRLLLLFNQNNHLFPFFAAQFSSAALHSTRNENERKAKVLRNQCSLNNKLTINSIISTTAPNVTSCSSHQPCQDNAPSWTERQRPNQQNAKPTSWVRSSGLLFLFTDTHPSQRFTKRARPYLCSLPQLPCYSWWTFLTVRPDDLQNTEPLSFTPFLNFFSQMNRLLYDDRHGTLSTRATVAAVATHRSRLALAHEHQEQGSERAIVLKIKQTCIYFSVPQFVFVDLPVCLPSWDRLCW